MLLYFIMAHFEESQQFLLKNHNKNSYICGSDPSLGRVIITECGRSKAIDFAIEKNSEGVGLFSPINDSKTLDVVYSNSQVILYKKHGGKNQQFQLLYVGPDRYAVLNRGKCLTREDTSQYFMQSCDYSDKQIFAVIHNEDERQNLMVTHEHSHSHIYGEMYGSSFYLLNKINQIMDENRALSHSLAYADMNRYTGNPHAHYDDNHYEGHHNHHLVDRHGENLVHYDDNHHSHHNDHHTHHYSHGHPTHHHRSQHHHNTGYDSHHSYHADGRKLNFPRDREDFGRFVSHDDYNHHGGHYQNEMGDHGRPVSHDDYNDHGGHYQNEMGNHGRPVSHDDYNDHGGHYQNEMGDHGFDGDSHHHASHRTQGSLDPLH